MNQLLDLIQSQISDSVINEIGKKIGETDQQKTANAAQDAMSALLAGLAKNARDPQGAASLNQALEKDHDGSMLDNLMDMINGNQAQLNSRAANGAGILKHIFGEQKEQVAGQLAQKSAVNQNQMSSMMEMLAPLVMGALGKTKKQSGFDITDLISMLNTSSTQQAKKSGTMGMLGKLLDRDGDGNPTNDIIGMGMKMLGGLFKRK